MSIKSQEGHMRQLALLLTTDLGCIFGERESGPNGSKKAFLNVGKVFLRALAKDLGLHEVTVSANSGGIAVSGTCSLYGMWEDRGIAVWIEQRLCADGKVLCYAGSAFHFHFTHRQLSCGAKDALVFEIENRRVFLRCPGNQLEGITLLT